MSIKRVIITGPESSGKSHLSHQLANHYHDIWMPEYAREYCSNLERKYTLSDVQNIADTQLKQEKEYLTEANNYLFYDTWLIITKIWMKEVFDFIPDWIDKKLEKENSALVLICFPDLEWEPDPLRENPSRRDYFFDVYYNEYKSLNYKLEIIKGFGNERTKKAIESINSFFK